MEGLFNHAQELLMRMAKHGCDRNKYTLLDITTMTNMNYNAVSNNMRILLSLNLVTEERREGFPPKRLVALTEKGIRVAEKLAELKLLLSASS